MGSCYYRRVTRLLVSAYEWHEDHGPLDGLRPADWQALLVAAAIVTTFYVAALLAIDSDYFLSFGGDPLKYFLKAARFAATGRTDARLALNLAPFRYVSLPGVLLAPVLWASSDFAVQLRLVQLINAVGFATCFVLGSSIAAARVAPARRTVVVAALAACTLVNRIWFWEVSLPNATIPFMLGSFGATLAAWAAMRARGHGVRAVWWCLFAVGALMSFAIKFTAASLLGYAALLLAGRALAGRRLDRFGVALLLLSAMGMGAMAWNGWDTIQYYASAGQERLAATSPEDWGLYFGAVALPNTVLPEYRALFAVNPLPQATRFVWMTSTWDVALVAAGLVVSSVILLGAWRLRRAMLPEGLLVASVLPFIAPVATSTPRYLLPYAPWVWIFALAGARPAVNRLEAWLGWKARGTLVALSAGVLLAVGWIALRHSKSVRSTPMGAFAGLRANLRDVTDTYRAARMTLEALPRDRSELLLAGQNYGWGPVLGLSSYAPDDRLRLRIQHKEMYLMVVCEPRAGCKSLESAVHRECVALDRYGPFTYVPLTVHRRPLAALGVYRVLAAGGSECGALSTLQQERQPPAVSIP